MTVTEPTKASKEQASGSTQAPKTGDTVGTKTKDGDPQTSPKAPDSSKIGPKSKETEHDSATKAHDESKSTQKTALENTPFMIKFIKTGSQGSSSVNTGSLHSSSFKGKDPSAMPLAQLRRLVAKMSADSKTHTFCTLDGTAADDHLTFGEYLLLDHEPIHEETSTPSIIVRFRKTDAIVPATDAKYHGGEAETPADKDTGEARSKVSEALGRLKPELGFTDRTSSQLTADKTSFVPKEQLSATEFAAKSATPVKVMTDMDENDWAAVLKNCAVFYGWRINRMTNEIERAETPAFKLRDFSKLKDTADDHEITPEPTLPPPPPPPPPPAPPAAPTPPVPTQKPVPPPVVPPAKVDPPTVPKVPELSHMKGKEHPSSFSTLTDSPSGDKKDGATKADDAKQEGFKKDESKKDDGKKDEPKKDEPKKDEPKKDEPKKEEPKKEEPKKEEKKDVPKKDEKKDEPKKDDKKEETKKEEKKDSGKKDDGGKKDGEKKEKSKATKAKDVDTDEPDKISSIPSYVVNDRSRIEISMLEHQFQESMAKNQFSSTEFEASVSGGTGKISGGATGGFAKQNSTGAASTRNTYSKTMIATYMFPRVTVYLRPEDLEPTDELKRAMEQVKKSKNINDLRKLHSTFGQLFCHRVTLGGCLQTTRTMTASSQVTETEAKDAFKANVGIAVSSPWVTAEAKLSREKQSQEAKGNKMQDTLETMLFEATGGNTILAASPPEWSSSVADFNNWRVIDRSGMILLVDVVSRISGLQEVKSWFLQAVPKFNEYIAIPDSRAIYLRLRLNQNESLKRVMEVEKQIHEQAYLAHNPDRAPKPVRRTMVLNSTTADPKKAIRRDTKTGLIITDLTTVTSQETTTYTDALFYPYATQAPVLIFPGGVAVGTVQDKDLFKTVWRIEVASDLSIGPDCKVCLKSLSSDKVDYALTVYRTQQGIFRPAMSSTDEPCFWRFERVNRSIQRDEYKYGEEVRLVWRFSDQSGGYRDFFNDTYGRRSFVKPDDYNGDELYLKVPFPRFENADKAAGVSLLMSAEQSQEPFLREINVRPTSVDRMPQLKYADPNSKVPYRSSLTYNLHDVSFFLDFVGDLPTGDALDEMNVITSGTTITTTTNVVSRRDTFAQFDPTFFARGGPGDILNRTIRSGISALTFGLVHL